MKTILVAIDGSSGAAIATAYASELATSTGAELAFVCVAPGPFDEHAGIRLPRHVTYTMFEARAEIAEAAAAAARYAGLEAAAHRAVGDPVEEIAILADDIHADLVVVGSRGLGAVRRALLGSVSLGLVKRSSVPVLVVKPGAAAASAV